MNIINTILAGIHARIDDALFALIGIILVQLIIAVYIMASKRMVTPMPLIEIFIRPVAVFLTDKLNRDHRSDFSKIIRGAITVLGIALVTFSIGLGVEYLCVILGAEAWMDVILLLPLLSPLLSVMIAGQISHETPVTDTYRYASQALNQNLIATDTAGQRRNGYRLLVLSFTEWCLAPIIFYLLGGAPLAYSYVVLSVFCRVSIKSETTRVFLSVFEPLWRVMRGIVTVFGILLILVSSVFSPGGRPLRVLKSWPDIPSGLGMQAAYAYAQDIVLGGAVQDRMGHGVKQKWLGADKATAKLTHQDIVKGCVMHAVTVFITATVLLALYLYW